MGRFLTAFFKSAISPNPYVSESVIYVAMAGGAFVMPSLAIERSAATLFIGDYEKRMRPYIATHLIFMQYFLSISFTAGVNYG